MADKKKRLRWIYRRLFRYFGQQHWWPADSDFEVAVGAILTQNTSWSNVEKAIQNLKKARCLSLKKMLNMSDGALAKLIRPAGYYNIKAKRLKNFLKFLKDKYKGSIGNMRRMGILDARSQLLSVNGIGEETADSILLYALGKPIFVVDAYTKRIAVRHGFVNEGADYKTLQHLFMDNLPNREDLFNEYHALIVRLGKEFCKKNNKNCILCPINEKNRSCQFLKGRRDE